MSWPRLTETLAGPRDPHHCQACGADSQIHGWQEHDEKDQPEPRVVMLCERCSDHIIEPHPRLYRRLENHEPFPGAMPVCANCKLRDGVRCTHPDLKANGGSGLKLTFEQPSSCHVDGRDKNGRRFGRWMMIYHGPVECPSRQMSSSPACSDGDGVKPYYSNQERRER